MNILEDINLFLMFGATEKHLEKGEDLKVDAPFYLGVDGVQHYHELVGTVVLHGGCLPCLISLKLVMDFDSL